MKKQPKPQKLFVIKKYVWATSAKAAILKDKKTPPDECWVDEDWKKGQNQLPEPAPMTGFNNK